MAKKLIFTLSTLFFFLAACSSTKDKTVVVDGVEITVSRTIVASDRYTPLYIVIDGDSIFTEIFRLKKGYILTLFPEKDQSDDNTKPYYSHSALFSGCEIDTIVANAPATPAKHRLRYNRIDFNDYFVLEYAGDGNYALNMSLIAKETGKTVFSAPTGGYDTDNELLIYYDDDKPNPKSTGVILYDVARGKSIDIIADSIDKPCMSEFGHWTQYTIDEVTPTTVYLSYHGCGDPIAIKVER